MDDVAMATICVDPQILEEHVVVEATIDASCTNIATRLATLNNSSWYFLEAIVGAFDEDYKVVSQHARAYLKLRANRCVSRAGTHDVEALTSCMSKDPIIIDISDDEE
ncbi:hypothetical protein D1007_17733 [Hordeum vulgare]|nr:hypothetical protein D1007_17733 [Hordeum vulgare]